MDMLELRCREALAEHLNIYYDLQFMTAEDIECLGDDCFMYKGCKRGYVYVIQEGEQNNEVLKEMSIDGKLHEYCIKGRCFTIVRVR